MIERIPMTKMTYATENEGMAQVVADTAAKVNEIIDAINTLEANLITNPAYAARIKDRIEELKATTPSLTSPKEAKGTDTDCPKCDGTKFEGNGICPACNGKGTLPNE